MSLRARSGDLSQPLIGVDNEQADSYSTLIAFAKTRIGRVEYLLLAIYWAVTAVGVLFVVGTLLSITRHSHWFVRGWDFPRVQIAAVLVLTGVVHLLLSDGRWYNGLFVAAAFGGAIWQLYKILPYTRLAHKEVRRARHSAEASSLRIVVSNVLMENEQHDRWLEVIRAADPDVVLALEVNDHWMEPLRVLETDYPHVVCRPQDNYYGMVLLSRLELVDPKVRFIVEEDIPSIHTGVVLGSGERVYLHGVHPRPPEPIRGTDSTTRDAEIVVMGREIDEADEEDAWNRPTVIVGDFNDVAWSRTTELFLRLSGLLDPRRGRGFYNSFDANSRWFRFPVDHVFHSDEFALSELRVLDYVGSDHFPVFVELCYAPDEKTAQPPSQANARDQEEAEEAIQQAEADGNHVDRDPI